MLRRTLLLTGLFLFLVDSASALPIFARRYETSCTTCHAIIPKLNPFGVAFRNNAYRIPLNDERILKIEDVSLGAPAWKKLWPEAVWPGKIAGLPPVAFRATLDTTVRPSQPVNLNFDFPSSLQIYFAGPAGDTVSFFGSLFLQGSTNSLFIDRAWAQFRLLPETPGNNWVVLKVGRIDLRAEPFSSTNRRVTTQNFNVSDLRSVSDGLRFRDKDSGVELWGAATGPDNRGGIEYAAGIVQGTGGTPENNNFKDSYWTISYKVGGQGVVGSRREVEGFALPINNYAEKSVAVGTFGYRGKGITRAFGTPMENQFTRSGFKVDAYYDNLNVYGAVSLGKDNVHDVIPRSVDASAFYVEADYMLFPWMMSTARFEKTNFSDGRRNVRQMIPSLVMSVRANVRVLVEGHFFNKVSPNGTARTGVNEGVVRIEFAF
jgi:hypothetical protein